MYAKPYRLEGLYEVRLISKEDTPSGEFLKVLKREFGVIRFDPAKVRRHCEGYDGDVKDVECFIRIDAGVVKLKPNVAESQLLPTESSDSERADRVQRDPVRSRAGGSAT